MNIEERLKEIEKILAEFSPLLKNALKAKESPRNIFQELIQAGQIDPTPLNGKYVIYRSNLSQFIEWVFDNNYEDDISPELIFNRFRSINTEQYSLTTIKKYFQRMQE